MSKSKQIWNGGQQRTDKQESDRVRHKIRKSHEPDAAQQGNEPLLLLSIDEVRKTDRTENHAPEQ